MKNQHVEKICLQLGTLVWSFSLSCWCVIPLVAFNGATYFHHVVNLLSLYLSVFGASYFLDICLSVWLDSVNQPFLSVAQTATVVKKEANNVNFLRWVKCSGWFRIKSGDRCSKHTALLEWILHHQMLKQWNCLTQFPLHLTSYFHRTIWWSYSY